MNKSSLIYIKRFSNNLFSYYLFYSFFAFFLPCISSQFDRLNIYRFLSSNSILVQKELWVNLTIGYLFGSFLLSFLYLNVNAFKAIINKFIFVLSFPLRIFLRKTENLKISNLKISQIQFIFLLLGSLLLITQSFFAIWHHMNDSIKNIGGISGRFYPNPTQNALFSIGNIFAVMLSFYKQKYLKILSIIALSLGLIGQALDVSRYSFVSLFLIIAVLFLNANFNFELFFNKFFTKFTLKKSTLILFIITFSIAIFTFIKFSDRMPILSLISYQTGFSFYNIGTSRAVSICIPDFSGLILNLSGLPIFIANKLLGANLAAIRIDVTRPLPAFDYLNCFLQNHFMVGVAFSLLLFPVFVLISKCNNINVKLFSLILILFSSVTFFQYDIRMTLRILQITIILLAIDYNLKINKIFKTNRV